ncbi:acyl-CoA dehydrogenase family protein [Saccharopolyspora hordei]|uniref:Alkylation response protein AidB-like acyl-CoA dehydrogenase n=1 Tax=Saccharopolyspora hordei TaxID=1838 RepID=A0A853AM98_9PSEU|nr:acyl-CoA dehydrogenase family protein [Saccharopolyspora hordei]NYI85178.1 alkylation response protein AidB-like acyl-CoA dehydrogenase [Saccharopolyspora hordei]
MSTENSLITRVAADVLSGVDPEAPADALHPVWPTLVELGWPQVGVPEERGGAGGSLHDLVELVAATAASGVSVPLLEVAVSRWVLGAELADAPLVVTTTGLEAVPWARHASHVLVRPEREPAFLAERGALEVVPGENLAGEPRDAVRVTGATTALPDAPSHEEVLARAALLKAAALLGAARGAYRHTREHVTQREQFGRPLVALKPVASSLAEMRVHLVATEAAVARAARGHEEDPDRALAATAAAKVTAARTATSVARAAHQLHGAMGVTREHPLHHVTRKLWAWRDESGTERSWSARLGRAALTGGEAALWDHLTA